MTAAHLLALICNRGSFTRIRIRSMHNIVLFNIEHLRICRSDDSSISNSWRVGETDGIEVRERSHFRAGLEVLDDPLCTSLEEKIELLCESM